VADISEFLKQDATMLSKMKHPNILQLVELPLEDSKTLAFVTEPVEYPLSYLFENYKTKHLIPGLLDIKLIILQLMESLHFLHNNAKRVHLMISPENIYLTKDGKVKLGGMNCLQEHTAGQFKTVQFSYQPYCGGTLALAPNLRFTAPEIGNESKCSFTSDVFSLGCIIFYLVELDQGKDPFMIKMENPYLES